MNQKSNRRWFRYAPLAVVVALLVGFAGFYFVARHAFSAGSSRGLVENRAEWPEPIRDVLAQAARKQIDPEPVQMYRVIDFTEKTYYWSMRSSPELIALMIVNESGPFSTVITISIFEIDRLRVARCVGGADLIAAVTV